jgi:hypothetical protein
MRSSLHPVHSETRGLTGVIEGELSGEGVPRLDLKHGARLELPAESMKSGNRLQDMEMLRRLDVRRFPSIEVVVDRAWQLNGGSRFRASVRVTAHGRTRIFEEDFSLHFDGRRLVVEGEHFFDMRDFDVNPPGVLGFKVQPQVRIRARIVADQEEA